MKLRVWPWSEIKRLREALARVRDGGWETRHWNERDTDEWVAWATYPIEIPMDSVIEKATISGPPWEIRLAFKDLSVVELSED